MHPANVAVIRLITHEPPEVGYVRFMHLPTLTAQEGKIIMLIPANNSRIACFRDAVLYSDCSVAYNRKGFPAWADACDECVLQQCKMAARAPLRQLLSSHYVLAHYTVASQQVCHRTHQEGNQSCIAQQSLMLSPAFAGKAAPVPRHVHNTTNGVSLQVCLSALAGRASRLQITRLLTDHLPIAFQERQGKSQHIGGGC